MKDNKLFNNIEYIRVVFRLLGDHKKKLPFLIIILLLTSFLDLIGISMLVPYIDLFFNNGSGNLFLISFFIGEDFFTQENLSTITIFILCLFVIKTFAIIWANWKILAFCKEQEVRLRTSLARSYLDLPYEKYVSRNISQYVQTFSVFVGLYSSNVLLSLLRILSDCFVILFIIFYLANNNIVELFIVLLALTAFIFLYDYFLGGRLGQIGKNANFHDRSTLKIINEIVEGMKEIKIFGVGSKFLNQLKYHAKSNAEFTLKSQIILSIPKYLLEFIVVSIIVITIAYLNNTDPSYRFISTLSAFGYAGLRLMPIISTFSSNLSQIRYGKDSVNRLYQDVSSLDSIKKGYTDSTSDRMSQKIETIELKDVSYSYQGTEKRQIDKISIKIEPGSVVGIIGKSGSGKTTLMDLILGLLKPTFGVITYGSKDINSDLLWWWRKTAYIPQNNFLIDGSFRENIALGINDEEIDAKLLNLAIKKASLEDLIDSSIDGVDTKIGYKGLKISGGQRQRLALARAFYFKRKILFLDEVTSALDKDVENEVTKQVEALKGNATVFIVTHRIESLKDCDLIIEINNGKAVKIK